MTDNRLGFLKIYFISVCARAHMHARAHAHPKRPVELSIAGAVGGCDPPNTGTGNRTHFPRRTASAPKLQTIHLVLLTDLIRGF